VAFCGLAIAAIGLAGGIRGPGAAATHAHLKSAQVAARATSSSSPSAPVSGSFTLTDLMTTERQGHTATLLSDGRVLIAGGWGVSASGPITPGINSKSEIYDPKKGTFRPTGAMVAGRQRHTATLLRDGRVLIVGGSGYHGPLDTPELYDPKQGTFSLTGSMAIPRDGHTATLLPDGRVLVAGGTDNGENYYASAELYDPKTGSFSPTGSMATPRSNHTAPCCRTARS
jgi:hypothetical protein